MAAKIRKRIATFCRALAARLDPQPVAYVPWPPISAYTSNSAGSFTVTYLDGSR